MLSNANAKQCYRKITIDAPQLTQKKHDKILEAALLPVRPKKYVLVNQETLVISSLDKISSRKFPPNKIFPFLTIINF